MGYLLAFIGGVAVGMAVTGVVILSAGAGINEKENPDYDNHE